MSIMSFWGVCDVEFAVGFSPMCHVELQDGVVPCDVRPWWPAEVQQVAEADEGAFRWHQASVMLSDVTLGVW